MKLIDDDLYSAALRIGGDDKEALKWVVKYAQADLPVLSPGLLQDLRHEVAVFSLYGGNSWMLHTPVGFKEMEKEGKAWIPDKEELEELQAEILPWFLEVPRKAGIELRPQRLSFELTSDSDHEMTLFQVRAETPQDAFKFYAFRLLVSFLHHLRRCLECNQVYVADRSSQKFCSLRCLRRQTQRVFQRKKRKRISQKLKSK